MFSFLQFDLFLDKLLCVFLKVREQSQIYKEMIAVIFFLQLRDIALKRFRLTELDDLPRVVFVSAFLATAGKNVSKLPFHSKVTT